MILDEVDQLQDKTLLYDLYRLPKLTMILIANRQEDVFATLDSRLRSRLGTCASIRFNSYNMNELVAILEDRIRWGLEPDVITDSEIRLIADKAAGDARRAIGILRNATRMAAHSDRERIRREVIEAAVSEADSEIRKRTTDKLTEHQQVLYEIIEDAGEINPRTLYDQYTQRVGDPRTKRTMRNHLNKLEQYNLITASGNTKARTYCPQS